MGISPSLSWIYFKLYVTPGSLFFAFVYFTDILSTVYNYIIVV